MRYGGMFKKGERGDGVGGGLLCTGTVHMTYRT